MSPHAGNDIGPENSAADGQHRILHSDNFKI